MQNNFLQLVDHRELPEGVSCHPTALIAVGAEIATGVEIGPYAMIGPRVVLKEGVIVGPSAVITGRTTIGRRTQIFASATVGTPPQDLKYQGEETSLVIGEDNMIREYVNISIGTVTGGGVTSIGNHNLVMAYTHIAHDCHIGNHCIFANGVQLAGHVIVEDHVVFGGMSGGHQFCRFGTFAMVGAGAIVVQDVVPFVMVQGDRARVTGLNVVGLRRSKISKENHSDIKKMYRLLFKENLSLDDTMVKIQADVSDSEHKEKFLGFLQNSKRGLCR